MIAVTFALPAESARFRRRLKRVQHQGAIMCGFSDRGEEQVCVVHTGVGGSECEKRLTTYLRNDNPRLVISSGFCGSANHSLAIGDILLASNYSTPDLLGRAQELLAGAIIGRLFSASRTIDSLQDRYAIGRAHNAVAIDMETEVIARICTNRQIPLLSARVVSDSPAAPFPAPAEVLFDLKKQRTSFSVLLAHLGREPAAVIRFVRFAGQISLARRRLADALCSLVDAL
jgi:nucleoside phosphorylase